MSAASLATLDGSLRMTPVEQPRPPALADLGSRLMIVVERREDWASYLPSEEVLTAQEYLEQSARDHGGRRVQVINLCRGYKYLGLGYYCSLLAEARGHRVIPSLRCISELARKSVYGLALGGLDKALDKALCRTPYGATDGFTLTLYFGHTEFEPLADLARQLFEAFPCPILLVEFRRQQGWHIEGVRPGVLNRLRSDQEDVFADALDGFSRRAWRMPRSRRVARYDMAILHDPDEALPPSNPQALANFVRVGASLGIDVELIGRKDYARLAEFDALLIRETTRVDHHTYRFAEKAGADRRRPLRGGPEAGRRQGAGHRGQRQPEYRCRHRGRPARRRTLQAHPPGLRPAPGTQAPWPVEQGAALSGAPQSGRRVARRRPEPRARAAGLTQRTR